MDKIKKSIKGRKVVKIGVIVLAVTVLAVTGVLLLKGNGTASAASSNSIITIGTGDLEKNVTGTGSISISKTQTVSLDFDVTVSSVAVKAGQSVKKGDTVATPDISSLDTTINTLTSSISTLDNQIAQMANQYSTTETLKATTEGRVKQIYAETGENVADIIKEHGALIVLSLDGKMKVSIANKTLKKGDEVTVVDGDYEYDGEVASTDGTNAVITFSDKRTVVDATVKVLSDTTELGSGKAEINMPFGITGEDGQVSKIYVDVNDSVSSRTSVLYLKNVPASNEYATLLDQKTEAMQQLQTAKAIKQSGVITSEIDGIVSSITAAAGKAVTAGSEIVSLYVGDATQMVVSIDELDIGSVTVGQEATIAMDAVTDKEYKATVSYISEVGTTTSGVTVYSVTLDVEGDGSLKIGMNGTATIVAEQRTGVVLVPISALQSSKGTQYVWLYSDSVDSTSSSEPGIRTTVTTGLSSDSYAEVLTGLKAGDKIVVVRSSTSDSSDKMMGGDMMNRIGVQTQGNMGQPPSGGGQQRQGN